MPFFNAINQRGGVIVVVGVILLKFEGFYERFSSDAIDDNCDEDDDEGGVREHLAKRSFVADNHSIGYGAGMQ